jgi:hypothetical protein
MRNACNARCEDTGLEDVDQEDVEDVSDPCCSTLQCEAMWASESGSVPVCSRSRAGIEMLLRQQSQLPPRLAN